MHPYNRWYHSHNRWYQSNGVLSVTSNINTDSKIIIYDMRCPSSPGGDHVAGIHDVGDAHQGALVSGGEEEA